MAVAVPTVMATGLGRPQSSISVMVAGQPTSHVVTSAC
jgi:hypothetical protein